jgi:hypothetical protein
MAPNQADQSAAVNWARLKMRPPLPETTPIDAARDIWLLFPASKERDRMIRQSREHLRAADEGYWQHFRFATTFGLLATAAGIAAVIHAIIPGICTSTASRIVRHLGQLIEDRSKIDAIESEAVEARAFVLLLMLAAAVVAPLWILDAPTTLRIAYTVLAFALPATLMVSNPELLSSKEPAA